MLIRRLLPVLLLSLCGTFISIESSAQQYPAPIADDLSLDAFVDLYAQPDYLANVSYDPREAEYFDIVNEAYQLTDEEIALLEQNGFVVSDRLYYEDFIHAYAWIYWQDLPVIITTDSMLQSVHYAFSEILFRTEVQIISPMLDQMLNDTLVELRQYQAPDDEMAQIQADLDAYLSVAIALLNGSTSSDNADARPYIQLAMNADTVASVPLFNSENRQIDFTRFDPVGSYYRNPNYYRAMTWLSQIDMRMVDYNAFGEAILNPENVSAAILLHETMANAGARETWDEMEAIFQRLFGISDNTNLFNIDGLIVDAGFIAPQDALTMDEASLLELLVNNDYGQQRIAGQILTVSPGNTETLSLPLSFMLFGQRFSVDSYIFSNLTFDRLQVGGRLIRRPFPEALDLMFALGNNRAVTHLMPELETYNYQGALAAQRTMVENLEDDFWMSTSSSQWLNMLRYLSEDTTGENYPQAMQTAAWSDRMLQGQLASWAQLRHDTLLYTKESVAAQIACEYPAGYVEPYPEFYAALAQYAEDSYWIFSNMTAPNILAESTINTAIEYYLHLQQVAEQLEGMSHKILNDEPFSEDEEAFLRDITVMQDSTRICGLRSEEWDGWYADLYPWYDELNLADISEYNPVTIAAVHSNSNTDDPSLMPPGVLYTATGRVSTQLFVLDTDGGLMIYAGPVFSYYEFIDEGDSPGRLNDIAWNRLVSQTNPPVWTGSFRVPRPEEASMLVPGRD